MKRPNDKRYVGELPSGVIKSPDICEAGADIFTNDALKLCGECVYPMYDPDTEFDLFGFAAANASKGQKVLVARR